MDSFLLDGRQFTDAGLEGLGAGTWAWDIRAGTVLWSRAMRALYGIDPASSITPSIDIFLSFVHEEDRAHVMAVVSETLARRRSNHEQQFRIRRLDGGVHHILSRARLLRDPDGQLSRLQGIDIDLGELAGADNRLTRDARAQGEQRKRDELCRVALQALPAHVAVLAPDGRILATNAAWSAFALRNQVAAGLSVAPGASYLDICRRASSEGDEGARRALAGIEAVLRGESASFSMDYPCHSPDERRWFTMTVVPLPDGGRLATTGVVVTHQDISERKLAEERQGLLMREMAHRSKNLLAVMQSIASQTLSRAASLEQAREALEGRLQALARTFARLTDEAFQGAPLDDIARAELASYGDRAALSGPKVMLSAKVAQMFALVVHELATNAAKYGALSTPEGRLDITWSVVGSDEGRRLRFEWRESGGPAPNTPSRHGFGTTLVSLAAGMELGCTPELSFAPEGFCYRVDAPLSGLGIVLDDSVVRARLQSETLLTFYDAWASLRGPRAQLPSLAYFDRRRFQAGGGLTIAECHEDGRVELLEVGKALTERLGRSIESADLQVTGEESLATVYLRCTHTAHPSYERLRFDFGDGEPVTLERLLVPFCADGPRVSHVAGMVVISGETRARTKASTA